LLLIRHQNFLAHIYRRGFHRVEDTRLRCPLDSCGRRFSAQDSLEQRWRD
jgi:hypothetical protein